METGFQNTETDNTSTVTEMRGVWLVATRTVWMAIAVLVVVYGIYALPLDFAARRAVSAELFSEPLAQLGLSYTFYAAYFVSFKLIVSFISVVTAVTLFIQRANNRAAYLVSLALLAMTITVISVGLSTRLLAEALPRWLSVIALAPYLGQILATVMIYTFPTGRFGTAWVRWAIILYIVLAVFDAYNTLYISQQYGFFEASYFLIIMLWAFVGLMLQIYRYRRVYTSDQRQQVKWVLYGMALVVIPLLIFAILEIIQVFTDPWNEGNRMARLFYRFVSNPLLIYLPLAAMPASLWMAMQRSRLWDIDFVINRSLVYGALTVVLGVIFVGGFYGLRGALQIVLGSEQAVVSAVVSTAIASMSFGPTRTRLRRFVDRRYGIRLDYIEALKAYGTQAEVVRQLAEPRSTFGNFTGLELLGRGGMGEVYRAEHPTLGRSVALKLLIDRLGQGAEPHQRFVREAQTVARLQHPNIVAMYEVGEEEGTPFMVMEYIAGDDLSQIIKVRRRLPLDAALPLLEDIAAALDYAHAQGIVHRDIKPSNVMLQPMTTSDGKAFRAVLMDFGIARLTSTATQLTGTGMVGTLDYIAPEQIQGASEVDARADIYALGVMAYQMLAGELPFKRGNPGALVMAHLMEPPPDVRKLAPDIPRLAARAIIRAMAKRPEERFETAGDFIRMMI